MAIFIVILRLFDWLLSHVLIDLRPGLRPIRFVNFNGTLRVAPAVAKLTRVDLEIPIDCNNDGKNDDKQKQQR